MADVVSRAERTFMLAPDTTPSPAASLAPPPAASRSPRRRRGGLVAVAVVVVVALAGWFTFEHFFRTYLDRQITDQTTQALRDAGVEPANVSVDLGPLTPWGLIGNRIGRVDAQADLQVADFGRFHVSGRATSVQLHNESMDLKSLSVRFELPVTNFAPLFRKVLGDQELLRGVSLDGLDVVANPSAGTATVTAGSWASVDLRPDVTLGQLSFTAVNLTVLGFPVSLSDSGITIPVDLAGQLPQGLTIQGCSINGDNLVVDLASGPMTVK